MKKLLLLILPLLAITFNSCSKDDDGSSGGENSKLVKQVTYEGDASLYFEYDNQRRITKITYTPYENPSYKDIANVSYSNNKVIIHNLHNIYHLSCEAVKG